MAKWVYFFGGGKAEGKAAMGGLLGGKGANLAEMSNLGLPVPPGFTITTEACTHYYAKAQKLPRELKPQVETALKKVGRLTGKSFGDRKNPLLVSVRSGARASMPGMMDTVLNLGLNDVTVEALAKSADPRFAYDSYRRFIQMYSNVVLDIEHHHFEELLEASRTSAGSRSIPNFPPTTGSRSSAATRNWSLRSTTHRSRRTRTISFGARSMRCSVPG
jgi:pyruvate, orthophosphate dikinase